MICDEVQEIPLGHEANEPAVGSQMREIPSQDLGAADDSGEMRRLLMRSLQELVEQAKFMHQFQRRRMDRVAAKIAEKIRVLFEDDNFDPARARRKPSIIPAGPPPAMQQRICCVMS